MNDRFWKTLWLTSLGIVVLSAIASASLFFAHIETIDTAAVGVSYVPDKDPFENGAVRQTSFSFSGGYVYKDSFPLGLSSWTWDSQLKTSSGEQIYQGLSSLKATVTKAWGGFGVSGLTVDSAAQKTFSFAVYPDTNVGDLFVELYDKEGASLGRQSVGWYTASGALTPGQWQVVSIPVQNLLGSSTSAVITALSFSSTNAGTMYIDSMQFSDTPSSHDRWVYKAPIGPDENVYVPPPFNPFATSTAEALPYTFTPSATPDVRWYAERGFFEQLYDVFKIGPLKGVNSDAFAFFRNGRNWTDYQVTANVNWGGARVFALIVRMQDDQNYASCSFSAAGDTLQMYNVVNGVSTEITQSDKLHYSDYNGGLTHAGAEVQGNTLSCGVDGTQILSESIPDMPTQGTVGMEAWDPDDSALPHEVQSFKVVPLVGE